MDIQALQKSLQKGPAPSYLLCGEEDVLVDQALNLITSCILGKQAAGEFVSTRFDGKSASAEEIEASARTFSLFGKRRLVVVRDAQDLKAPEQKKITVYLERAVAETTLVLVVRGGGVETKDPRRQKAAKAAKAFKQAVENGSGVVVDCPRPKARELPALAERYLAQQELRASSEGLHALMQAVGEDLGALIQAVEKLALYKRGRGEVEPKDVIEVVVDTREESVFALVDAVAEGATGRALGILRRLVREGESSLSLLGHLVRHFRQLARVQSLQKRRQTSDQIKAALGLHPFVVKKCQAQSSKFSDRALRGKLQKLTATDSRLKRSRLPDDLELETLVVSLCSKK